MPFIPMHFTDNFSTLRPADDQPVVKQRRGRHKPGRYQGIREGLQAPAVGPRSHTDPGRPGVVCDRRAGL